MITTEKRDQLNNTTTQLTELERCIWGNVLKDCLWWLYEFVIQCVCLTQVRVQESSDPSEVRLKLEKLDLLEQEYQRLTLTQNAAEAKIRELERKLQEEEHQRKLVQDKAAQVYYFTLA